MLYPEQTIQSKSSPKPNSEWFETSFFFTASGVFEGPCVRANRDKDANKTTASGQSLHKLSDTVPHESPLHSLTDLKHSLFTYHTRYYKKV